MEKGKKTVYFVKTKDGKRTRLDAEQSLLPLLPKEKHLTYYAMLAIMTAGAIASWAFVTGTAIGVLVPVKYGLAAAAFGCTVSFAIHAYSCVVYSRWGTDMSVIGRSVWGHRGIYLIILGVGFPATYGWGSLPIIMLGKSTSTLIDNLIGSAGLLTTWQFWSFIALFFGLVITYIGTTVIDKFTSFAAPVIVALIIFICYVLAKEYGFSNAFNALPQGVSSDRDTLVRNYMIAVEICLGVGFSWPYLFSAYTKPSLSESGAYTPSVFGSGICWALCCVAPAITAALTGLSDPVEALANVGSQYVVVWMIMLAFANSTSVMVNPYFLACSLTAMFPKIKWKTAVAVQLIYAVAIIFPIFYTKFGTVIAFIGMVEAPAGCIWALDYYLKRKINLRHCYGSLEDKKKSAYWYFNGFNLAAWIGLICGSATGIFLYNPWTAEIALPNLFDLMGGMIPASIVGTLVYYLIDRFYQQPRKIGVVEMHKSINEYSAEVALK